MMPKFLYMIMIVTGLVIGCRDAGKNEKTTDTVEAEKKANTFGEDMNFLKKRDSGIVILATGDGKSQVIVSPKYQGKVFTSTSNGLEGNSYGWINYTAFDKVPDLHMNAFGGEDRLWLGPEGGAFSLFFKPGKEMVFDNWHTPSAFDTESWNLISSTKKQAQMEKSMSFQNYAGLQLEINIKRNIEILETSEIEKLLSISLGSQVKSVGFKTINILKNAGSFAWDKKTGAPCMWNLDMFTPTAETVIIIPFEENAEGKVATTDYFGEIPSDRIKIDEGVLFFKADGKSRGKLGIPPTRVKPVAGSYAADAAILTITLFDVDKKGIYLNQEWTTKKDPYSGDAMNAYNDGPLADGTQMGPFYEIESVSAAAFLSPGEEILHNHSVFHFTGDKESLNVIAQKILGVSLDNLVLKFKNK
jgi:hypothetical protein